MQELSNCCCPGRPWRSESRKFFCRRKFSVVDLTDVGFCQFYGRLSLSFHWGWDLPFLRRHRAPICYKVPVLCGNPDIKIHVDPFWRLATIHQSHRQVDNTHIRLKRQHKIMWRVSMVTYVSQIGIAHSANCGWIVISRVLSSQFIYGRPME